MQAGGILAVVLPVTVDLIRLERLVVLQRDLGLDPAPDLRLAALIPADAAGAANLARRLRLSNAQKDRLGAAAGRPPVQADLTPAQARAAIYAIGADAFLDRTLLAWAAAGAPSNDPACRWAGAISRPSDCRPVRAWARRSRRWRRGGSGRISSRTGRGCWTSFTASREPPASPHILTPS
jgi:hypothetical protein